MNPQLPFFLRRLFTVLAVALFLGMAHSPTLADDPFAPKPAVPPGFMVVGGDILVPEQSPLAKMKSAFRTDPATYWPNGTVPYEWDGNVSPANRVNMLNAMMQWEAVANVHFVLRNGEPDYVHIQNSTGNNSRIGRVGGPQFINIVNWGSSFIMAHELGHCLGFDHTQTRSDRDAYIKINYNNIQSDYRYNFDVAVGFNDYGPYDFDSVMEYGQCALSVDCSAGSTCLCTRHVIDVLPPNDTFWQSRIGQRNHLSTSDQLIMSFLYPEPDWRFVDASSTVSPESGSFLRPDRTFTAGEASVPSGGTVWIQPGTYAAGGTHAKPITLRAPWGE